MVFFQLGSVNCNEELSPLLNYFGCVRIGVSCVGKHHRYATASLVRNIPETFKGLGLSQQVAFRSTKAMLAGT